jgi:hypothetical protein
MIFFLELTMQSFEDIRLWAQSKYTLRANESYLLSFDISLGTEAKPRAQSLFAVELETENGAKILRFSTPIVRMARVNAERCLRFNWAQRVGYLAIGELDGKEWLHLCENRPYAGLNVPEVNRLTMELAMLADQLEQVFSGADHV